MMYRTTFRTKLLLLTIVPLAVAQVVTLFAIMRTVQQDVRSRAQQSLTAGAVVVDEYLAARTEQLQTSVGVLAADYGLKEATATNDAATIRSVLENHSRRVGADIAALVDLDGNLVASTIDIADVAMADIAQSLTLTVEQRRTPTTLVAADTYHLFTVPLRAPVTIGWVILGFQVVLVVLQRSVSEAMAPYIEARGGLFAFGAALLALVAIAGGWFSTTIARPLRTLRAASRRMISGDYDRNVDVVSDDEFGELASSFNAMQKAIGEREQRISHHALHDPLTDLPNRAKILKGLTSAIEQARKTGSSISVLSIRLVRMNEISSTLGHGATDELIKMAARHLQADLGDVELLGHTGTNEFVLVLPGHDVENALSYVDRIDSILGSGIALDRINIILQTEIGIAEFPRHCGAAADLLRFASIARTEAEANNEHMRVYQPGRENEFLRRLKIVNDLPSALRRGDIEIWFQPKVSLPDGKLCGAEALVRWTHADLGFLSPDDFIPAAEQSGTIVVLTRHVIDVALRECRTWENSGHSLQVSVNLSARDLLDEYLPYHVMQSLKEHGLPANRLTLEVTENSIMEQLRRSLSVLECLKDIGVRISMDDFGTGHSSLAQLRNIPLHELKIDKSFIMSLCNDEHNESIVRTTIELAHGMGLGVVAEGVEDEAVMRRIAGFGCEQAQGYFISKPIPAQDALSWLEAFEPVSFPDRRGKKRVFAG
jgi:diguanylate cyclase (GGDEF)-like protein